MRRWGAAALDLAYVAAGRYEGYWERRLNLWDIAAGIIIVREAGGLIESFDPATDLMETAAPIAANAQIFNEFARTVRGA